MKRFFIGLFTGFVLAAFAVLIVVLSAVRLGQRRPSVEDASTLIVRLDGDIPERPSTEIPIPFMQSQPPPTVAELWSGLRRAAADPRIKAVIVEPRNLMIGWAVLQEIHSDLVNFRQSGKALVAYLHGPGNKEYYLATAADRIVVAPEDLFNVRGLHVEATYLKNTLDKLGIRADVVHAGKYKDAGDIFTMTAMSPETREVMNDILDQYYGDLVQTIAGGRRKSPEDVRRIIDQAPFSGRQALAYGLVDANGFADTVSGDLQKRLHQSSLTRLDMRTYLRASPPPGFEGVRHRIAYIAGSGVIVQGSPQGPLGEDTGITSEGFTKLLRDAASDSSISGAIIRVDSPGGDGVASDEILQAAKDLSRRKPVVISMSDLAASGGYFIAMTGDPIVAYPNTLTGSIGVIFAKFNLHGLYDKIGITKQILTRGQYADLYSDYTPMSDADRAKITSEIDDFYSTFIARVSEGRRRPAAQIQPLAQGRVWLGAQAKQNGLVDQLGGLDAAVELIKQKAHIASSERVTLVPYPPRRTLLEQWLERSEENPQVEDRALRSLFGDFPMEAWLRGGVMKIMPYTITVQ